MQSILQSQQQSIKATPTAQAAAQAQSKENEIENLKLMERQNKLLEKIEENTRGKGTGDKKKEEPTKKGLGLDGLITAVAVAAGTVAGLISAWVKTIKFFVTGIGTSIEKVVVFLSKWFPSLRKILFNIEVGFVTLVEGMKGIFKNAVGSVRNVFGNLIGSVTKILEPAINFFKGIFGEGSAIGKVVTAIKTAVSNFINPLIEGFKVISETSGTIGKFVSWVRGGLTAVMEWFGGIGKFFSGLGSSLGQFSKIFSAVSGIVSKIAYPLMVVMAVWDTIKGAMAGWEEGGLVGAIGGAIKGLFNSLIGGVLDLIKGAISWIAGALGFTAVEEFLDSFSFSDMFGSFVDAVLFIPKKIQEFIMSPIESMKKIGAAVMDLWNKIPDIMGQFFDAVMWLPNKLFGLIDEYIVQPLANVFKPVTDFFSQLKEQVFGFFEDFGIPEIGFTIPVIDKKVSIGPFYPFRPEQGSNRVGGSSSLTQTDSATGGTSNLNQTVITSGQEGRVNRETGETYYREDKTNVLTTTEKVGKDGSAVFQQNMATFDPNTGKATISGDAGEKDISKRAFGQIKRSAQKGGDNDAVAEIIKEDEAYQKLGFFDRRKVDVGYAKASDLLAAKEAKEKPAAEAQPVGFTGMESAFVTTGDPRAAAPAAQAAQQPAGVTPNAGGTPKEKIAYAKEKIAQARGEVPPSQQAMPAPEKKSSWLDGAITGLGKLFGKPKPPTQAAGTFDQGYDNYITRGGSTATLSQAEFRARTSADAVASRSADNAALKDAKPAPAPSTTVVSAPVNNNSTNVLNSRRPLYDTDAMGANNFWSAQSKSRLSAAY